MCLGLHRQNRLHGVQICEELFLKRSILIDSDIAAFKGTIGFLSMWALLYYFSGVKGCLVVALCLVPYVSKLAKVV